MSTTKDDEPFDNELKAYLAGEDGVSAAYQKAGAEQPPAELDRAILAAAHGAVYKKVPRKRFPIRQTLPIAASFMVGVLITSMYFDQVDDLSNVAESFDVAEQQLVTGSGAQPAAAPAPAFNQEPQAAALERGAPAQAVGTDQQAEPPATNAPPSVGLSAGQIRLAPDNESAFAEAQAKAGDSVVSAESAARQRSAQGAESAASVASRQAAEESQVRGEADIAGPLPPESPRTADQGVADDLDVSYRQSRDAWLETILALGQNSIALADELEDSNARLEEEIKLFSEMYPDADIEGELRTLRAR